MPNMLVSINTMKEVLISHTVHLDTGIFPHFSFTASGQTWGPFLMDLLRDKQGYLGLFSAGVQGRLFVEEQKLAEGHQPDWENRPALPIGMSAPGTGEIDTQPSLGMWLD